MKTTAKGKAKVVGKAKVAGKVSKKAAPLTIAEGRKRFHGELTEKDKVAIRKRHAAGEKIADIARSEGMSNGMVWLVLHPEYRFPSKNATKRPAAKATKKRSALAALKAKAKKR